VSRECQEAPNEIKKLGSACIIWDICNKMDVPRECRTTAQIMFYFVRGKLYPRYKIREIALCSVFLAAKSTEHPMHVESLAKAANCEFLPEIEREIMRILNYQFEYFDVYKYVRNLCREMGFPEKKRLDMLDKVYSSCDINKIGFITEGIDIKDLCFFSFEEEELRKISAVHHMEIDKKMVSKLRTMFCDSK